MPRRATHCAVVFAVVALWLSAGCAADGPSAGQGASDRPSPTASLPPTRALPSLTRSPDAPEQSESAPPPSRSLTPLPTELPTAPSPPSPTPPTRSPEASPTAPTSREPEPQEPPRTTVASTVIAVPVPASPTDPPTASPTVSSSVSPAGLPSGSPSPVAEVESAAEGNAGSATAWVVLLLVVLASALAVWFFIRSRTRRGWLRRLDATQAEVAWFARELVPQLRRSGSVDEVAGGWRVAGPRVSSVEDDLTVLASSAPSEADAARARQLRDAVRSASERLEALSGAGRHDEWALDLDDVQAVLETALRPESTVTPTA